MQLRRQNCGEAAYSLTGIWLAQSGERTGTDPTLKYPGHKFLIVGGEIVLVANFWGLFGGSQCVEGLADHWAVELAFVEVFVEY